MENLIKDENNTGIIANDYVLIPKMIFWSFVVTIVMGLAASFIHTQIKFVVIEREIALLQMKIEKDLEMTNLKVNKDLEILSRIEKTLNENTEKLLTLEKSLLLKKNIKLE